MSVTQEQLSEKCDFRVSPFLPGSEQAQVTWGGIVKRLLIAYFTSNISEKKMSKSIHVCQSYTKPKVGRFSETRCTWKREDMQKQSKTAFKSYVYVQASELTTSSYMRHPK